MANALFYQNIQIPSGNLGGGSSTDEKAAQTETNSNEDLELLLSSVTGTATVTSGVKKSTNAKLNPSTGNMTLGGKLTDVNGVQSLKPMYWDDYQALSTAEKNNGVLYHILDKNASYGNQCVYQSSIENISYYFGAAYDSDSESIIMS